MMDLTAPERGSLRIGVKNKTHNQKADLCCIRLSTIHKTLIELGLNLSPRYLTGQFTSDVINEID
jgi:hypothetical protein